MLNNWTVSPPKDNLASTSGTRSQVLDTRRWPGRYRIKYQAFQGIWNRIRIQNRPVYPNSESRSRFGKEQYAKKKWEDVSCFDELIFSLQGWLEAFTWDWKSSKQCLESGLDPDSIRSMDPDLGSGGQKWPSNIEKSLECHVLKCWMVSFEGWRPILS